jgi:hypothetical protein
MALPRFRDVLIASAADLGYESDAFRPLDDTEAAEIAATIEVGFGNAVNGAMSGWWHSDRPCPLPTAGRCFGEGGLRHLAVVGAESEPVWLLAENWGGHQPRLIAFSSTVGVVQEVLGNTHGFEYLVASQHRDWLFAEDHHDCVSVAGADAVREFLSRSEIPA